MTSSCMLVRKKFVKVTFKKDFLIKSKNVTLVINTEITEIELSKTINI